MNIIGLLKIVQGIKGGRGIKRSFRINFFWWEWDL